jgi:dolichyldiphosphatase
MGYFASFLMLHLYFRHRFSTTGSRIVDQAWRVAIYLALLLWALVVAYSRYGSKAVFFHDMSNSS